MGSSLLPLRFLSIVLCGIGYFSGSILNGQEQLVFHAENGSIRMFQLQRITPNGPLGKFSQQNDSQKVAWDEFYSIGSPPREPMLDQVVLRDGSILVALVQSINSTSVTLESRRFQVKSIDPKRVHAIIFSPRGTPLERQKLLDQLRDRGDKLEAQLTSGDLIGGELHDRQKEGSASLRLFQTNRWLSLDSIRWIVLNPADKNAPTESRRVLFGWNDGTLINANKFDEVGEQFAWELSGGLKLVANQTIRGQSVWKSLCYLKREKTDIRFLSEQKPFRVVEKVTVPTYRSKMNRNVFGGPLTVGDSQFQKGIGTHSESQLVYLLKPGDRIFRCWLGLDQEVPRLAQASCQVVLLQADNTWKVAAQHKLAVGAAPIPLEIDVQNARAIGLVTREGEHGTIGDRVNWAAARFIGE